MLLHISGMYISITILVNKTNENTCVLLPEQGDVHAVDVPYFPYLG